MIRLTRALVRRPPISERAFGQQHDAFVRLVAASPIVKRTVRAHAATNALTSLLPGQPPRNYDGLLDLWFEDATALLEFLHDRDYAQTVGIEAARLFDLPACNDVVTGDYPAIFDDDPPRFGLYSREKIRFTTLLKRNPALTFDAFVAHHRNKHAPLFASVPAIKKNIGRYIVAHTIDVPGMPASWKPYDGVVDFYFDDIRGLTEVFVDRNYLSRVHPDELRFLDLSACDILIGREFAGS